MAIGTLHDRVPSPCSGHYANPSEINVMQAIRYYGVRGQLACMMKPSINEVRDVRSVTTAIRLRAENLGKNLRKF